MSLETERTINGNIGSTEKKKTVFDKLRSDDRSKGIDMIKKSHWIVGVIFAFSLIISIFFTSFQVALYADFNVYKTEYEKYDVLSELDMTMDDAMYVTHEMMDYLIGERHTLSVITTVEGTEQDFFNEQDRFHMAEVKGLFQGGLAIRFWSTVIAAACLVLLYIMKADFRRILPRSYLAAVAVTAAAVLVLGAAAAIDFNAVFVAFHHVFFDNDLWIFDPDEDYMIRMLPEGLFADMVVRIAVIFAAAILVLAAVSAMVIKWKGKNSQKLNSKK